MTAKRKGRPPLPKGERRTEAMLVCVRPAEMKRIRDAAKVAGTTPTAWVRDQAIRALALNA